MAAVEEPASTFCTSQVTGKTILALIANSSVKKNAQYSLNFLDAI